MKRTISRFMLFLLITTSMITWTFDIRLVEAYHSGVDQTHHFIFNQAMIILENDGFQSYQSFLKREANPSETYLDRMKAGSDWSDELLQNAEHYMDAMDHLGFWGGIFYFKSAGTLCQEKFDEAVSLWEIGDYYNAMYNLGWATHLIQDLCVPHHAWTTALDWHSEYENWVNVYKDFFAVNSDGIYSFPSFPDSQYYTPSHYNGSSPTAYDWVDYNAHESIQYFMSVNSYVNTYVNDIANPYIETIHHLPNNLETSFAITTYHTDGMQLHFEKIDMEDGFDYIYIMDANDSILDVFTGDYNDFWTPSWYFVGDTLKIKTTTDSSVQSWGYKLKEVKYFDLGEDLWGATNVLLPRAQRTTAGFIKFFFDTVEACVYNNDTGRFYSTIQEAIDAPQTLDGHTILVGSGTYHENIIVNKRLALIGENKLETIIDGSSYTAIVVESDDVQLAGFTIQNCADISWISGITIWDAQNCSIFETHLTNVSVGISIYYSSGCNIHDNTITDNLYGIILSDSENNTLQRNIIANGGFGVRGGELSHFMNDIDTSNLVNGKPIYYLINEHNLTIDHQSYPDIGWLAMINSTDIQIHNLTMSGKFEGLLLAFSEKLFVQNASIENNFDGISIIRSSNITIQQSKIKDNIGGGVLVTSSSNITLNENDVRWNCGAPMTTPSGIHLYNSSNCFINGNIIADQLWFGPGLSLWESTGNLVSGNNLTNNAIGLKLDESVENTIVENFITGNDRGIEVDESSLNEIFHNSFISNLEQVYDTSWSSPWKFPSTNSWDNGYPSGGNYWSDYTGVDRYCGPNQNITGWDWIGDTVYVLDEDNEDNYPLTLPWGSPHPTVKIIPETMGLVPNQTFTIACVVQDVTELCGFGIRIKWNTTYLGYIDHEVTIPRNNYPDPIPPSPYGGILNYPVLLVADNVDAENGTYECAASELGGPSFNGSGTLFTMTFQVLKQLEPEEEDIITVIDIVMHDLANPSASPIPHETSHGTLIIHSPPPVVEILPERIEFNDGDIEGKEFTVAVVVEGVPDLMGFGIKILWNTTWLGYVNHMLTSPMEEYWNPISPSPYHGLLHSNVIIVADSVNVTAGTYETAVGSLGTPFYGSGTAFIITYRVLQQPALGEEDVTTHISFLLHDLADSWASPISHEILNGTVVTPALKNIAIMNFTKSKSIVGKGYSVNINVTAQNQGFYSESVNVTIYGNTTTIQRKNVTLTGTDSTEMSFMWNTTNFAKGNYTISVSGSQVTGEINLDDNFLTDGWVFITIPGDVDADHDVDIFDIVCVSTRYGLNENDFGYDANYDLDGDGDIDIFDIVAACGHYGESW